MPKKRYKYHVTLEQPLLEMFEEAESQIFKAEFTKSGLVLWITDKMATEVKDGEETPELMVSICGPFGE